MCESCRRTATPRDLQPLRQSSTLLHRPRSYGCSMPRSRAAAAYDRKSSVTNRSGARYISSEFAYQFQSGMLVALGLDQHIENLALGVDFVKMPGRMRFR